MSVDYQEGFGLSQPLLLEFTSIPLFLKDVLNDDRIIIENSIASDFLSLETDTETKNETKVEETFFVLSLTNKQILKKCFQRWKQLTNRSKDEKLKKIDSLIEEILKFKQNTIRPENEETKNAKKKPIEIYKKRFQAQKALIEIQKTKITEQNKMIENLKLGIIKDEINKSVEEAKVKVREIREKLSPLSKIKTGPQLIDIETNLLKFIVNSRQAPKFALKMEERAYQRARNREIILEKKKRIDEEKQRIFQEAVENKRIQDEEEKKRNLEAIKEKRRKELEIQKARKINKEKFFENWNKAERFHTRKILRACLYGLLFNFLESKRKYSESERFYEVNVMKRGFKGWMDFMEEMWKEDKDKADRFWKNKLLRKMFDLWLQLKRERMQSWQVAEDFCDYLLVKNHFVHWYRYVCVQYIRMEKLKIVADNQCKNRLMIRYFYHWKSLPAVIQLEKTKEERKKKWRERVWEILPDYKPPEDD